MRILYLIGGRGVLGGEATVRDANFVRGLRALGHDVDAVSLSGHALVDGGADREGIFFSLERNSFTSMFPRLTRVPYTLAGFIRKPRPVTDMTSLAVDGRVDHTGPEAVNRLAGRDKQLRRDFARLIERLRARDWQPDMAILSNIMLSGLAEPIRGTLSCRIICLSQGSSRLIEGLAEPYRSDARKLARKNARFMAMVIATSRFFAIRCTEFLALPPSHVRIVPPGIDVSRFAGGVQPRNRDPFIIGFLAPISNRSGLDILVDTMDMLVKNPKASFALWIAGPVEDERYWQRLRRRLDGPALKNRHNVLGVLAPRERREFLSRINVFAIASREPESKGMLILEAMATGLPVVGPSAGIIPEIFQHVNGGLLVSSESPAGMLAQAFELLATMPETADKMGRAAAEGVAEHFSIESSAGRLAELLEEAASYEPAVTAAAGK